jgi:hypothetical protein
MLGGGLAERPEFVGLFSNNVLEERVMRLMETKTVLSARARLVRMASGATAMAAATLMATSFHVVPMMAAESEAGSPVMQTALLRATVLGSSEAPVALPPTCVHRSAKPAVAPTAPVPATPVAARVAVAWSARPAVPGVMPAALPAFQSAPAVAPPAPVVAPAPFTVAPTAPVATPVAPEVAPIAPVAPADVDKEMSKKEGSHVYRMTDMDGKGMVIIDGKMRALSPEEKEQIEKAMDQFKNGDFAKHAVELQQEMAKLKIKDTFDSPEFREKMEAAQREFAQSALVNNAELQARVQAMVKNFDKQNMYTGHCKDGAVKDKDKEKQKKPANPQIQ